MPRACASEGVGVSVMASKRTVEDLRPELRHGEHVEQDDQRPKRQRDGDGTPAAALQILRRELNRHYTSPAIGWKRPRACSARRAENNKKRYRIEKPKRCWHARAAGSPSPRRKTGTASATMAAPVTADTPAYASPPKPISTGAK